MRHSWLLGGTGSVVGGRFSGIATKLAPDDVAVSFIERLFSMFGSIYRQTENNSWH